MSHRTRTDAFFFEKDSSAQGNLIPQPPAPDTKVFSLQLRQRLLKGDGVSCNEKKAITNESDFPSLRKEPFERTSPSTTQPILPSRPMQTAASIPYIDRKLFRLLMIFSMDGEMLHGRFGGRLPVGFLARRFQQVIRPGIFCMKDLRDALNEEEIRTELCVHDERWIFWVTGAQDVVVVGEVGERCDQDTFISLAGAFLREYRASLLS